MDGRYYPETTLADEFIARDNGVTKLLGNFVESAPWIVASLIIHVVLFAALALLTIGGAKEFASVDLLASMQGTPTPEDKVEETPVPTFEEDEKDKEVLKEDIEDPIEEPEDLTDPDSPTDQQLAPEPDLRGMIGVGGGHWNGAYSGRGGPGGRPTRPRPYVTDDSETAVLLGLQWLADHQESDGHWDTAKWGGHGPYDPGVAGLALLAFAGAGHTEKSGKYRNTVRLAIKWLADHQDAKGNFAPGQTMYNHAIPTLALLEEVGMAPSARTKAIATRGLEYMLSVQNDYKAWRYWPKDGDNDVSVTAWCVMAMKAATIASIDIGPDAWAGVRSFLDEVTEPTYGEVGYTARPIRGATEQPFQKFSMTACGLLMRLYLGVPREDRLVKLGVSILSENMPDWNQPGINAPFFYYWYYASLVMFQIEGEAWKKWNKKMYDLLVQHQITSKGELCGSWDAESQHHFGQMGGRVVSTAFAVLTLETSYRYEAISKTRN